MTEFFQTGRSPFMIYPYYVMLWGSFGASTYMMCRQVLVRGRAMAPSLSEAYAGC